MVDVVTALEADKMQNLTPKILKNIEGGVIYENYAGTCADF